MSAPLYERDPEAWNAYLAEGNAKQPRKRVAVDALIWNDTGRILVVKPNYKPGWDLPGGMVEANEPPLDGLRRELAEELDLHPDRFRLLCVDWVPPHGPWDDQLAFIFDAGTIPGAERDRLSLHDNELGEYQFVEPNELSELLRPRLWRRARAALDARRVGDGTRYLHDGNAAPDVTEHGPAQGR